MQRRGVKLSSSPLGPGLGRILKPLGPTTCQPSTAQSRWWTGGREGGCAQRVCSLRYGSLLFGQQADANAPKKPCRPLLPVKPSAAEGPSRPCR